MFEKVLIVEDQQTVNFSVQQTAKDLGIGEVSYAYYCDDALLRLKVGIKENKPFNLLIADLSFAEDRSREQELSDGTALIATAKKLQPNLQILVFSGECSPAVAKRLVDKFDIDGYVCKGREDAVELRKAVESISRKKKYFSIALQQTMRHHNSYELTTYDLAIISQLAQGTLQKDIPVYLQQKGLRPTSLSSIEKRLGQIKADLEFTKNEQLVAYCKDHKII